MSTCFLHVPDPDDQPFDDDEPNKPIAPGDRWCSLWAPREPGGPRLPCHPSIEGTADEWLLIAGAIEAGAPRAFGRVAFAPAAGGGELWSPHNSTGDRDHVRLTTAELVELAADVRAKLAPPATPCCIIEGYCHAHGRGAAWGCPSAGEPLLDRPRKPDGRLHLTGDDDAPAHPRAEDGSGPTTGAATGYRCLTCGDNGYVLGGVGGMFDEQAEDPCPDCGPASPPAPGPRPPDAPTAAPARVDFTAVDPGLAAQPPGNADFYRARSLFMADRGYPYMTPAEQVLAEQEWEATMIEGPSATAAQAVRLLEAMAAAKPGDSRPPGVPTSAPDPAVEPAEQEARLRLEAQGIDVDAEWRRMIDDLAKRGSISAETATRLRAAPVDSTALRGWFPFSRREAARRALARPAVENDADAIVRVLDPSFLPALRAAIDRRLEDRKAVGDLIGAPAPHPSDITREAIIARAKALTAGPWENYEVDDADSDEQYGKDATGPGGFRCRLGEPEDCNWYRDGAGALQRLNQLNVVVGELLGVIAGKV